MGMQASRTINWDFDGRRINRVQPEHCLLLVGYDDDHYIFNDPQSSYARTYYNKAAVKAAYKALSSQAIVIQGISDEEISQARRERFAQIVKLNQIG